MIVVDASVVVKWFIPENDSDKATALLRSGKKLVAPEIIRIEVAAAFTRLYRTGHLDKPTVATQLEKWRRAIAKQTVSLEPTRDDFDVAADLSIQLQHQLQDCLYVAAADRLGVPLVTADAKLLKKSKDISCSLQSRNCQN